MTDHEKWGWGADFCLTLAAGRAVIPVSWQAALTVTPSGSGAAQTAVGERMAGGAKGSRPAFTPPAALTAGETRVTLLHDTGKETFSIWVIVFI